MDLTELHTPPPQPLTIPVPPPAGLGLTELHTPPPQPLPILVTVAAAAHTYQQPRLSLPLAAANPAVLQDLRQMNKQRRMFGSQDPAAALTARLQVSNGAHRSGAAYCPNSWHAVNGLSLCHEQGEPDRSVHLRRWRE